MYASRAYLLDSTIARVTYSHGRKKIERTSKLTPQISMQTLKKYVVMESGAIFRWMPSISSTKLGRYPAMDNEHRYLCKIKKLSMPGKHKRQYSSVCTTADYINTHSYSEGAIIF